MTTELIGDHHFNHQRLIQPKNPSAEDRQAKLEEVGAAFLAWAEGKKVEWREQLDEALALVKEHGRGVYGEMLSESYSDFNTAFSLRVMPVYDREYIDFWQTTDQWLFENVYKKGAEMEMLALFQHRGPDKVLEVLRYLAPVSSPKI
jgi:hypothetical protein